MNGIKNNFKDTINDLNEWYKKLPFFFLFAVARSGRAIDGCLQTRHIFSILLMIAGNPSTRADEGPSNSFLGIPFPLFTVSGIDEWIFPNPTHLKIKLQDF